MYYSYKSSKSNTNDHKKKNIKNRNSIYLLLIKEFANLIIYLSVIGINFVNLTPRDKTRLRQMINYVIFMT